MALLDVKDLKTYFRTDDGIVKAVDGVSFNVEKGKTLGIVGESGCGKSVTCLTIMGLNPRRNTTSSGEVLWKGKDLLGVKLISYDRDDRHYEVGWSAQQMREIIPEAVMEGLLHAEDDGETLLTVHDNAILTRCVRAIQQLTAKVASLEARLP